MRRILGRACYPLLGLVALWIIADFAHSRVVAHWIAKWEAAVDWNDNGVRQGCDAYSVGTGSTALLFLHGINSSPRCYDDMAAALSQKGFACRAMRLPGFAERLPRYAQSTHDQWLAAVDQEVDQLRKEYDQVGIVAHSLGGAVAIGYLLKKPNAVDALALLAPAVAVSNNRSPVLSTRAWHEFGRRALLFTDTTWSPFELDCHDPSKRDYPWDTPYTPLAVVNELYALMDENQRRAGQLKTPLLMILSKQDLVVDSQAAATFFEQVQSEEKSLRYLTNSGHAIPFDYEWKTVTDEIATFFDR